MSAVESTKESAPNTVVDERQISIAMLNNTVSNFFKINWVLGLINVVGFA
tara:strand:+ start:4136 stop:4285 length:150 start_codon:yes stop_codon:yes gene_type:complete